MSCLRRSLFLLLLCLTVNVGCSRTFWREQADRDSYDALSERLTDPRWTVPRIDILPDERSRFADPYDPDDAPLPPDDPAAHHYMQSVNGIKGYKSWHKFGTAPSIENPQWYTALGLPPDVSHADCYDLKPELKQITLGEAIELSYIHSRDYQFQLEEMYLASLDVTFRRFEFGVRYLGVTGQPPGTNALANSIKDGQNSVRMDSRLGISQLLPAGGQWAVEMANNTLWLFSGGNQTSSASLLSYSLTQPLLFAAGRKVVLNALTEAERTALYAVRDLARFRKLLFVDTVVGNSGYLPLLQQRQLVHNQRGNVQRLEEQVELLRTLNSQRKQIREPIYGLPAEIEQNGFPKILRDRITETQGVIDFDPLRMELIWIGPMSREQEAALLALVPEEENTDYHPALQRWLTDARSLGVGGFTAGLTNLKFSMAEARNDFFREAVQKILQQLRSGVSLLAVTQLETRLANARNSLRTSERQYENTLDLFKIQLGLPPDLRLSIDEGLLKPFELIDPQVVVLEGAFKSFVENWQSLDVDDPDQQGLKQLIDDLTTLTETIETKAFPLIEADLKKVAALVETAQGKNASPGNSTTDDSSPTFERKLTAATAERVAEDLEQSRGLFAGIRSELRREFFYDFASIEFRLQSLAQRVAIPNLPRKIREAMFAEIRGLREQLLKVAQNLQVVQINLRVELIPLNPFTMPEAQTIGYAMNHRLDLMNSRALVMDARRTVEVAANALEATLDLSAEGDIRVAGSENRAVGGRGINNSFRLGVRFDTPLDKVAERNAYRDALIDYQRQRRTYMAFEDQVKFEVRSNWRQLDVLKKNFETARQGILSAARQYDTAVELASAGGSGNNPNRGSSEGLNLINALDAVLDAQNTLIRIWVDYETARLNLYRDMGIMEIDPRGIWVDEFYQKIAFDRDSQSDADSQQEEPSANPLPAQNSGNPLETSGQVGEYQQYLPDSEPAIRESILNQPPGSGVPEQEHSGTENSVMIPAPEPPSRPPLLLVPPAPAATPPAESASDSTGPAQYVDRTLPESRAITIRPRRKLPGGQPLRNPVPPTRNETSGRPEPQSDGRRLVPEPQPDDFRLPVKIAP